ncbi:hypothetical protein GQR58_003622 [Nymphon striatum]|nr:hypothetical protein GQR58_003622 [Nymphon striatum]
MTITSMSNTSNSKEPVCQLQSFVKDLSKKDKSHESKKSEPKSQQEGQKPTMESTGPPLPNNYPYMHHPGSFLPTAYLPAFDPNHMYRGMNPMIMSPAGPYGSSPQTSAHYLPPQLRYEVPPSSTPHGQPQMSPKRPANIDHRPAKAMDLLQQHANQYYSSQKIQELQDRTNKSPSTRPSSPGTSTISSNSREKNSTSEPSFSKVDGPLGSDRSRSPPTQRHLHTHHHTHVGVGYPLYDPYGGKLKHQTEIVQTQNWKQVKPAVARSLDSSAGNSNFKNIGAASKVIYSAQL